MKKIKLLFIVHSFSMGGIQKINTRIINSLDDNIFDIHVLYFKEGILFEDLKSNEQNINKLGDTLKINTFKNFYYIYKIRKYIFRNNINIIHSTDSISYFLAAISARLTGIKHIRIQPNFISRHEKLNSKTFKLTPFNKWTNLFITLNDQSKKDLVSVGADLKKIHTFHGFDSIQEYLYPVNVINIKKELKIPKNNKVITAIHRMVRNKGYETFIEMIPFIIKEFKDVTFLLVGNGPIKKDLEDRVKNLGIEDHVRFTGFRKDIIDIAHSTTFGVYPLGDTAAMGTLLRAGKILISRKNSSMDEFIIHNKTGYLIDSDMADDYAKYALKLLKNNQLLKEMEINQIEFSKNILDGKKNLKEYQNLIIDLYKGKV